MYLLSIDEKTGLIKDDLTEDSWRGIQVFRDLVEEYGLEGLTIVALTEDYESPLRYYSEEDRGRRSMEEVTGSRNKHNLKKDIFVRSFKKYKELQFNPTLEQDRINRNIKIRYIKQLSDANAKEDDSEIERINILLAKHEKNISNFDSRFVRSEELKKAVTKNGYVLSRIEIDIESRKNSKFVNHGEFDNPDILNL